MNAVACVYVDAETQKKRVLDRGTMSEDDLTLILQKTNADRRKAR